MKISGPWGDLRVDPEAKDKWQRMIQYCITQLKHYKAIKDTPEVRKDIAGYEILLNASEATIEHFLHVKNEQRMSGKRKWNDELIEELKQSGKWEDR